MMQLSAMKGTLLSAGIDQRRTFGSWLQPQVAVIERYGFAGHVQADLSGHDQIDDVGAFGQGRQIRDSTGHHRPGLGWDSPPEPDSPGV